MDEAAAVSSLIVSVALGFAKVYLGDPEALAFPLNLWLFCGYVVFLVQFCFWQRIRSCFVAPCMVFLDKLCIHQTQPDLKQEGIAGLGAFVKSSDKLVVLWSSRYFTRLWCVYELGCFLKRSKPLELKILPVKTTAILLLVHWHLSWNCEPLNDAASDCELFRDEPVG